MQACEELQRMEGERIDEGDLATALLPKERLRVIQLLVEQVRYDGVRDKVTLTL